jgi:hypothetical protein
MRERRRMSERVSFTILSVSVERLELARRRTVTSWAGDDPFHAFPHACYSRRDLYRSDVTWPSWTI